MDVKLLIGGSLLCLVTEYCNEGRGMTVRSTMSSSNPSFLDQPNEVLKRVTEPIFERVLTSFRKHYEVRGQGGGLARLGKVRGNI